MKRFFVLCLALAMALPTLNAQRKKAVVEKKKRQIPSLRSLRIKGMSC